MPSNPLSAAAAASYLGWARQSVKGTAVAPTYFAAFVEGIDFSKNMQTRQIREAGGGYDVGRTVKDVYLPGLRFAMPIRPSIGAALMGHFLGVDTDSGTADPYTHTLTRDGDIDWLTFERSLADDQVERFEDGFITEVTLDVRKRDSGGPEPLLIATAAALDATREAAATSDSYESASPFVRSQCTWTIDSAGATNVERASVAMRWIFDEGILADSWVRWHAAKIRFEAEIEIVQVFSSSAESTAYRETFYPAAGAGTGTATAETMHNGDLTVDFDDGGSPVRSWELTIPEVDWTDAEVTEPDPGAGDAVRLTRTGHLIKNSGGESITVTCKNADATAYDGT